MKEERQLGIKKGGGRRVRMWGVKEKKRRGEEGRKNGRRVKIMKQEK